jgi:hypothetical protein
MRTQLASNFRYATGRRETRPLTDDEIRAVAPSIFADAAHESRSSRYTYIPTIDVLTGLKKEGFMPFMACQTRVRADGKRDHTKHMIRLRHADQIAGAEANEIVLLNSHDGSSSYQMLAGMFRFVCQNGMVCGETTNDIRIRHNGNVIDQVIEGAYTVLDDFEQIGQQRDTMKALSLNRAEQDIFARGALALKYGDEEAAPITESGILGARRIEDRSDDLWTVFNRVQENMIKGGVSGRTAQGRRARTRAVTGIDQNVKLNRALWLLGNEMAKLKG